MARLWEIHRLSTYINLLYEEAIRTQIIETSPGGVDLAFVNKKTGECTGFIPQGVSAEEIFSIPAAKRRWSSVEQVEDYIHRKKALREIYGKEESSRKFDRVRRLRLAAIINSTNRQLVYGNVHFLFVTKDCSLPLSLPRYSN